MVEFEQDGDEIQINVKENIQFLVLAGVPLNEPVVQYGPFVMNTDEQIQQAISDYRTGKFVQHKADMKSKTSHQTQFDPSQASIINNK